MIPVYLWMYVFGVFCFFLGLARVVSWIFSAATTQQIKPLMDLNDFVPLLKPSFNKEAFRIKIEDLFFKNIISLEAKNLILSYLSELPSASALKMPDPQLSHKDIIPNIVPAPVTKPQQPSPASTVPTLKQSGFFSSDNIKTLLISGSCLFIFGAYLFVKSYWEQIPNVFKFLSLLGVTAGIYLSGRTLLIKNKVPKTATTLMILTVLLIPFNFFAANVLLFNTALNSHAAWSIGFLFMGFVSLLVTRLIPTRTMGQVIGLGFSAAVLLGGFAIEEGLKLNHILLPIGLLGITGINLLLKVKEDIRLGFSDLLQSSSLFFLLLFILQLMSHKTENPLITGATFLVYGIVFAIHARTINHRYAYLAGLSLYGTLFFFLRYFEWPLYKFGLAFVPAGTVVELWAWHLNRSGKKDLVAPYHYLAQLAIAASLIGTLPQFNSLAGSGFLAINTILGLAVLSYALSTFLYQESGFALGSGLVTLLMVFVSILHFDWSFATGILVIAFVALLFFASGLIDLGSDKSLFGTPFFYLGLITVSLCVVTMAGKWGARFIESGTLDLQMPKDELNAGIWIGLMSAAVYGLMAWIKKQSSLLYPVLISVSLVYLMTLEYFAITINLLNVSIIVVFCMGIYTALHFSGHKNLSRVFAIWAQLVFLILAAATFTSFSEDRILSLSVCALSFLPGLIIGSPDLLTSFLANIYLLHFLWFEKSWGFSGTQSAVYSAQLLLVNTAVFFVRTLLAALKPQHLYLPYKIFVGIFTVFSLLGVLSDKSLAWQIYLATGVMGIVVSRIHYQGRFDFIGTSLLLASYELFLLYRDVQLTEAYSLPAGLYFLSIGFINRNNKDVRNFLYGLAQLILYIPSFSKALHETWEFHGIYLGILSIAVLLFGMNQRNKCLVFGSLIVLILNGAVQSFQFLNAVPRWIYLGLGGLTLVSLGGVFEFQREMLIKLKTQVTNTLEDWD